MIDPELDCSAVVAVVAVLTIEVDPVVASADVVVGTLVERLELVEVCAACALVVVASAEVVELPPIPNAWALAKAKVSGTSRKLLLIRIFYYRGFKKNVCYFSVF